MPGSGVHAGNIQDLAEHTKATSFHLSGKKRMEQTLSNADNALFESKYWETDAKEVERVLEITSRVSFYRQIHV